MPVALALEQQGKDPAAVRGRVEAAVRDANLNVIGGLGAGQYGIAAVIARLAEIVGRDERLVVPVGSFHAAGLTCSLPSRVGAAGVEVVLAPHLTDEEGSALDRSLEASCKAVSRLRAVLA